MESASSPQSTASIGGAGRVVVSVPRWIEVKDQRVGAETVDPSRTRHYVVSPHLSTYDAQRLAQSCFSVTGLKRRTGHLMRRKHRSPL